MPQNEVMEESVVHAPPPPRVPTPDQKREKRSNPLCYPTDVTDAQWSLMESLLPAPKTEGRTGRPREYTYREIVNGIFYVLRTGCTWDMMPHDLPPKGTCEHYFGVWRRDGTWKTLHDTLRERLRVQSGREPSPSAAVLDSQSVKTAEKGGLKNRTLLALMQESLLKDVSDIFSSIPTVIF